MITVVIETFAKQANNVRKHTQTPLHK